MLSRTTHFDGRPVLAPTAGDPGGEEPFVLPWISLALIAGLIGGLPLLLILVGQADLARYLYPATAFLLAAYLFSVSPPHYLGLCVWLFVLTPLMRRIADYEAGWQHVSPIMLAPFLASALTVLVAVRYLLFDQRSSRDWPFWLVLVSIAYGLLVAVLYGRLLSGLFEALRWTIPPCVALYILFYARQAEAIGAVLTRTFGFVLPFLGLYGILQFFLMPPWDAYWMANAPMRSIGRPEPFEVRVFSTLNSPLSLSTALTTGLLLLAARPSLGFALRGLPAFVALLLSLVRTAWGGLVVGVIWLFALGPIGARLKLIFAGVALALGVVAILTVPQVNEMIAERVEITGSLEHDVSARARIKQYTAFPGMLDAWLFGRGLGWTGTYGHLDEFEKIIFDSALIDIMLALGIVGGAFYLWGAGVCCVRLLWNARADHSALIRGSAAAVACALSQTPLGSIHQGELGFFVWLVLGLGLVLLPRMNDPSQDRGGGVGAGGR